MALAPRVLSLIFRCSLQADLAFPDKVKGGKSIFFPIDAEGRLMNQNQVLIDSGGPQGEELLSIALYAEYDCSTSEKACSGVI